MKFKPIIWLGDSLEQVRAFAEDPRRRIGFELWEVQRGKEPSDSKPMPSKGGSGSGARSVQDVVARTAKIMSGKMKRTRGSANVFEDLGFGAEEAENLLLRAQLMSRVRDAASGTSQREAAKQFGVSQPRLNDLMRGKIEKFSLDALVNMLAHAGMRIELKVRKAA